MKPFLFVMILGALSLQAGFAQSASRFEVKQMVIAEAERSSVPVSLALAVAKVESDFNARALSSAGARGVMQIMPATGRGEFGLAPDQLWDARTNVRTGVAFLERLYAQYNGRWDLALSHYNGGTIKNSRPHSYTRGYVHKVMKWQKIYGEQETLWAYEPDLEEPRKDDRFQRWTVRDVDRKPDDQDWGTRTEDFVPWGESEIIFAERTRPDSVEFRRPSPAHRPFRPGPRPLKFY